MLNFRLWLEEEEKQGGLDVMDKEFQITSIPPTITIPAGKSIKGYTFDANVEYATEVNGTEKDFDDDGDSYDDGEVPISITLTKRGQEAPYGKKDKDAPDKLRLSWDEFQELWEEPFEKQQQIQAAGGMGGGLGL